MAQRLDALTPQRPTFSLRHRSDRWDGRRRLTISYGLSRSPRIWRRWTRAHRAPTTKATPPTNGNNGSTPVNGSVWGCERDGTLVIVSPLTSTAAVVDDEAAADGTELNVSGSTVACVVVVTP